MVAERNLSGGEKLQFQVMVGQNYICESCTECGAVLTLMAPARSSSDLEAL